MILVDTSVWIELFRSPTLLHAGSFPDLEEVVTCLPVVQEVLQGFKDEDAYYTARTAMLSLPIVESPLGPRVYDEAIDLYRRTRRAGRTVRSGVDCLIAACARLNGLPILHHDRDFDALAAIAPLSVKRVTLRSP